MSKDSTVNIQVQQDQRSVVRTGFQLLITDAGGAQTKYSLWFENVTIGGPKTPKVDIELASPDIGDWQGAFHFRQGNLFFTSLESNLPVKVNDAVASFTPLVDGDLVSVGGYVIQICNLGDKLGTLEGCSEPHNEQMWAITEEPVTIGRGSERRPNVVELDDITVSREHATLNHQQGEFYLHLDTVNSPTRINGNLITQPTKLENGALLQFGQQLLRFRINSVEKKRRDLIPQEATILFSDIWDFSSFTEGRPLEETILQINEFYGGLGKVIKAHGGVLLTFLGDAMMAVFGAERPDDQDPKRAVYAALAMQQRLQEMNQVWQSQDRPPLQVGIGINSGEVMVGDVGFTGKLEFAAMGDNTNLAARVEKLTRTLGSKIIVTASTKQALGDDFILRDLGTTKVKGRESEVQIFAVEGTRD